METPSDKEIPRTVPQGEGSGLFERTDTSGLTPDIPGKSPLLRRISTSGCLENFYNSDQNGFRLLAFFVLYIHPLAPHYLAQTDFTIVKS